MVVNDSFSKMARFISELRKEKELTQKELAEQLGVTDKAVSKWERGLSCPDIALLSELSRVLGVTPGELLNGEKAEPADPQVDALVEATLQYADTATKRAIAKSARWKPVAIVSGILLLGILVLIGANLAIDGGLAWSILPVSVIVLVWLAAMFGAFVMEKNKIGSVLLCGFLIFMTTHYYSALNQAPTRAMGAAGFPRDYLPHYTIILIMFVVSIALVTISFLIQNRKISGDRVFLLATLSTTIIILSVLTVSSIVDYVDLNGFGVDGRFTILILLSLLMNGVSLALLARRYRRQIAETQKVESEAPAA